MIETDYIKLHEKLPKVYCPYCNKLMYYEIRRKKSRIKMKAHGIYKIPKEIKKVCKKGWVDVDYEERQAFCVECHNPVWINDIEAYNLREGKARFQEKLGIITYRDLETLEHKYGIGDLPLSQLLGWEEDRVRMIHDGATFPTIKESTVLFTLLHNDDSFYDLIEEHKNYIKPEAYEYFRKYKEKENEKSIGESELHIGVNNHSKEAVIIVEK